MLKLQLALLKSISGLKMENTNSLNTKIWNSTNLVKPMLAIIFTETVVLLYTIYSIPTVC